MTANGKTISTIVSIVAIVSAAFGAFLFLDSRHAHEHTPAQLDAYVDSALRQRILMSESTRYAEVAKYYVELMQERELTLSEKARYDLVQQQQQRIRNTLVESTE